MRIFLVMILLLGGCTAAGQPMSNADILRETNKCYTAGRHTRIWRDWHGRTVRIECEIYK